MSSLFRRRILRVERLEARDVPAVFAISNNADSGAGSLRQAIIDANARSGADDVVFQLGSLPAKIQLLRALPAITDSINIYGGNDRVVLDGSKAGSSADGITLLNHTKSTIQYLVINNFSGSGVTIRGGGQHRIGGNFIGTDATGDVARGNGRDGITIDGSSANMIGDTSHINWTGFWSNTIAGNGRDGVRISGASDQNEVGWNFIGTNIRATLDIGNKHDGVAVLPGATRTIIGRHDLIPPPDIMTTAVVRSGIQLNGSNVIGGNARHGVYIAGASDTIVRANDIGYIRGYSNVGGLTTGTTMFYGYAATPVKAGNGSDGILVGAGATGSKLQLNSIGNNQRYGIGLIGSNGTSVEGGWVGFMSDVASYGNKSDGIRIQNSSHNVITAPSESGLYLISPTISIANNGGAGIRIVSGSDNPISRASFRDNGGQPIVRGATAPVAHEPVIDTVKQTAGGTTTITGHVNGPANRQFRIDIFSSEDGVPNERTYLTTVTVTTNANGFARFSVTAPWIMAAVYPAPLDAHSYYATATDLVTGETSTMSPGRKTVREGPILVPGPPVIFPPITPVPPIIITPAPPVIITPITPVLRVDFAVAIGQGEGGTGQVVVTEQSGNTLRTFTAFAGFGGAVHVATGDVNGDGQLDILAAAGFGGGPHVRVFDGADIAAGREPRIIHDFFAYSDDFRGGVNIAAGDVNGDGKADIVTGAGPGGGPHVRVFDGSTGRQLASYYAYSSEFRGGVSVAVGSAPLPNLHVYMVPRAEVITGAGPGGGPHVRVLDALTGVERLGFFAFDKSFRGGVNVAFGDLASGTIGGSSSQSIIASAASQSAEVRIFSNFSQLMSSFSAFSGFTGGVRAAVVDLSGNGANALVVGAGPGGGPHVRFLDGSDFHELRNLFPFDRGFRGGVYVG